MRWVLLVLLAGLRPSQGHPPPLCHNGAWLEVAPGAVERGEVMPSVMCRRQPACVIHTHLTRGRCASRPLEEDWPVLPMPSPRGNASLKALLMEHWRDRTVIFVGDSITEGIWDWLVCDSHREGLRSVRLDDTERGGGRGRIDAQVRSLRDPEFRARAAAFWAAWFAETWGPEGPPLPMHTRVVAFPATGTLLVRLHAHRFVEADVASVLRLGHVTIFNYGLHYDYESDHTRSIYAADVRRLAQLLRPASEAPGRVMMYRETSAQHFQGTGAFTHWEQAHRGEAACSCEPLGAAAAADNKLLRMNEVARRELAAEAPRVRVLPFYDFTAGLHYAHEEDYCAHESDLKRTQGCCDCSHFCYTPQLSGYVLAQILDGFTTD